jgi:hypothetical protein
VTLWIPIDLGIQEVFREAKGLHFFPSCLAVILTGDTKEDSTFIQVLD